MKWLAERLQDIRLKRIIQIFTVISLLSILLVQSFYYIRFSQLTAQRTRNYAADIMNQVSGQLESYVQNVTNCAEKIAFNLHVQEFLITDDMERKFIELTPFLQDYLEYVTSSNQNIQDIILLDRNGEIVTSVMPLDIQFLEDLQISYDFSTSHITSPFFTPALENQGSLFQAYIMPIISTQSSQYFFEQIGYCVIVSKTTLMQELVLDISLAPNSHFFIMDATGKIIASNTRSDVGGYYEDVFCGVRDNRDVIAQEMPIEEAGLSVYSYISPGDLTNDMLPIVQDGLLMGVGAMLLMLGASMLFMSGMMKNVTKLVDFLRSMRSMGEIHQRVTIRSKNEIGMIAENVNQMLDQIDNMTHKILDTQSKLYTAEIRQKQMELSMLQSQINPHFLYNTLNCMAGIGLAYNVPEVVTIASAMSKIFRYCIKGPDLVELCQELECVEEYLKIMDIRYRNKFTYEIHIDRELLQKTIPKMLLQPIVENALYHGIEQKKGKSLLSIVGGRVGDAVELTIQDDGKGMDTETLDRLQQSLKHSQQEDSHRKSIGLSNIHSRIQLLYGKEYGLSVESVENQGTTVKIRIPYS